MKTKKIARLGGTPATRTPSHNPKNPNFYYYNKKKCYYFDKNNNKQRVQHPTPIAKPTQPSDA